MPSRRFRPESPAPAAGRRDRSRHGGADVWLYGLHAVAAALANPRRKPRRLLVTAEAAETLAEAIAATPHAVEAETVGRREIEAELPEDAVHQGAALLTAPLPAAELAAIPQVPADGAPPPRRRVVVVLDQVSDPHNIGAILRSAAAFGALAVVVPDRGSPEETAALAKAASGALETVPLVRVTNLARALATLKTAGFWCVGLDGGAECTLAEQDLPDALALVLGAEGAGLRRLTLESCDFTARLPIRPAMESLNVSNAAAVALYALMG